MMNLSVLTINDDLINSFKKHFEYVDVVQDINDVEDDIDILVLTNQFINLHDLHELSLEQFKRVFYIVLDDEHSQMAQGLDMVCNGLDIKLLSHHLTHEQQAQYIKSTITEEPKSKENVFTFISSVSNVGTTSTVLSVSQAISKYTNAKVGVLLLNAWDSGTDFIKYQGKFLNEIKPDLTSKVYDSNNFLNIFHEEEKDSLYILGGNKNTLLEREFTKEEIAYLIEKSKVEFDVLLIDGGSHFDNACMIQSLYSSDHRFVIANQQEKSKRKWLQSFNHVLSPIGFKREDFMLIVNSYVNEPQLSSTKDLSNEYGLPVLTAIEKVLDSYNSELNKKTFYQLKNMEYIEAINIVARSISYSSDFGFEEEEKRKKSLFSLAK